MAALHIWLLLFACVGASSGDDRCPVFDAVTVFGAPGGPVLLRLEQSELAQCEGECQLQVTKDGGHLVHKGRIPAKRKECKDLSAGCHVTPNGTLELTGTAASTSGNYTLRLWFGGVCKYEKHFRVHIQDRVSVPDVTYTCARHSSVQLSCVSANGPNPSYSWHMDGTPKWTLTSKIRTEYQSVLRNVTCTVKNNVSEERSEPVDVTCPEPVSEPEVQLSCFVDGKIRLCCRLENGTKVSYSWSVNGTYYNSSASCMNFTIPQMELINATCTTWNLVSDRTSRPVIVTCPKPVSEPEVQLSCFVDGKIRLCCRLDNGTEVSYSWSVNGTYYNSSVSCMNFTIPQTELINSTCTAWNLVSERTSRPVIVTCPETPTPTLLSTNSPSTWSPTINSTGNSTSRSKGCAKLSKCILWSAIGAATIIVVTVVPLVIGVLCTMPRKDEL